MNMKITFTDGLVVLNENIEGAALSSPESFLDVFFQEKTGDPDQSYDIKDIASIEFYVQEVKE